MSRRSTALLVAAFAVAMVAVGLVVSAVDDGGSGAAAAPGTACVTDPPLVAVNLGGPEGGSEVTVIQPDGSRAVVTPPDWVATEPDFTPDRSRLVVAEADGDFESAGPGGSRLWSIGVDGSDPRPITAEGGDDTDPAVSPDGATVAYRSGDSLATVPLAGGEPTTLVAGTPTDSAAAPEWSPAGDRIAYVRLLFDVEERTGTAEVWTVAPDGTGATRLAEVPEATALDWSPDGAQLLVSTGTDPQGGTVSTLDVEARTLRVVAERAPKARWSRGGTQVVMFLAGQGGDGDGFGLVERTVAGVDGADVSGGAARDLGVVIDFLYPRLDIAVAACLP